MYAKGVTVVREPALREASASKRYGSLGNCSWSCCGSLHELFPRVSRGWLRISLATSFPRLTTHTPRRQPETAGRSEGELLGHHRAAFLLGLAAINDHPFALCERIYSRMSLEGRFLHSLPWTARTTWSRGKQHACSDIPHPRSAPLGAVFDAGHPFLLAIANLIIRKHQTESKHPPKDGLILWFTK